MPAPRKPTSLLSSSTLKANVGRYSGRSDEPKPTEPLGTPPAHLTKNQKKTWCELATTAPANVLTHCDRWIVETAVILMTKIRSGTFTTADIAQLRSCLASLGMTPADRSRVAETKPDTDTHDEWSDLIN
jgi:phage terminase small subunit